MRRFTLPLVLIGAGVIFLLWRAGMTPGSGEHYPVSAAEVKKAGGFWKLSPEQQMFVRYKYIHDIQRLLEQANRRMQMAQFANDLPACYVYRTHIQRLQDILQRVEDVHCDPTAEEMPLLMVRVALK